MLKNYLKSYGYLIGLTIIMTLILSIINNFINTPLNIVKVIISIISILISSIILGRNTKEKAYIEGIKFSVIYLALTTIIKLILKSNINIKTIIIYLILIFTSIIGSMIGINTKKK